MITRVTFIALTLFALGVAAFIAVQNMRMMADGIRVTAGDHLDAFMFVIAAAISGAIAWFARPMKARTKESDPNQAPEDTARKLADPQR